MDLTASMALPASMDSADLLATKLTSTEFKVSTVSTPSMDLTVLTVCKPASVDSADSPATKLTSKALMDSMAFVALTVSKDLMECRVLVALTDSEAQLMSTSDKALVVPSVALLLLPVVSSAELVLELVVPLVALLVVSVVSLAQPVVPLVVLLVPLVLVLVDKAVSKAVSLVFLTETSMDVNSLPAASVPSAEVVLLMAQAESAVVAVSVLLELLAMLAVVLLLVAVLLAPVLDSMSTLVVSPAWVDSVASVDSEDSMASRATRLTCKVFKASED